MPFGQLNKSARYLEDVAVLRQIKQQYPQATFYGAAHSLGGALCDLFLQEGLLSQAISYNPAVERASGLGLLYKSGTSHLLTNFEGGGRKAHPRSYRDKKAFLLAQKMCNLMALRLLLHHNPHTTRRRQVPAGPRHHETEGDIVYHRCEW